MNKRRTPHAMWSLDPVLFRDSPIAGRGVFARRRFEPGDVVASYAPRQRRIAASDPEATAAAGTKLTLLSEKHFVIIPDTTVPGGWLCNHSCDPNADIYSDGVGRIQCRRTILPGQEVTIFYGWVTENDPRRDPCLCGSPHCRGFINFDISDVDAAHFEDQTPEGVSFRARLGPYVSFLRSIEQVHVASTIEAKLRVRAQQGRAS